MRERKREREGGGGEREREREREREKERKRKEDVRGGEQLREMILVRDIERGQEYHGDLKR